MKSIYKYLKVPFCLVAALWLAVGCSEEYKYDTDYSSYDNVSLKINLVDENDVLSVKLANKTHALTVAVTPENVFIDSKAYIYEVEDPSIASVADDGMITLLKVGKTALTVKFRGNQEISASCTLEVQPTFVKELKVTGTDIRVEEGKELDLAPFVVAIPSDADNKKLRYEVKVGSEELVEIAEGSSVVKALNKGTATIVVTTTDGSGVSTELSLEVTGKIPVSEIVMGRAANLEGKTFAVGQVFDLGSILSVLPTNASDPTLVYELVSGEGVVTLENGVVKTINSGTVKIKISAADGFEVATPQTIQFTVDANQTWFERALWKIDSSIVFSNGHNYTADGNNGPLELALDGNAGTYLALTKPDKNYDGHATPKGHQLFVIVDLTAEQEFNYFQYVHRNNNKNFQVWNLALYGSNDNMDFTLIEKDIPVGPNTTSPYKYEGAIPDAKYRYIKLEFSTFDPTNGYNLCIAEFNVCKK